MTALLNFRSKSRTAAFHAVADTARTELCSHSEFGAVQTPHLAALLAFSAGPQTSESLLRCHFRHHASAIWAAGLLARPSVQLVAYGGAGWSLDIHDPAVTLAPYGWSPTGQWSFGRGLAARMGMCRGAIHAACDITGHSMSVACPNVPAMLTMLTALERLKIPARADSRSPKLLISAHDLVGALKLLGMSETAAAYSSLRDGGNRGGAR